jgi:hypothetical protein
MRLGRCGGGAAVGERQEQPFQLSFNSSLWVEFQGSRVTSDGGLLLVCELDKRLRFGKLIERYLTGARGKNTLLPLVDPCGRRYMAGWQAMRMSTTPSASPSLGSGLRAQWLDRSA